MPIIANDTQFIGIAPSIDLTGKKSALLNEQTEPVTMLDIIDTVAAGIPPSAPLMLIANIYQQGPSDPNLIDISVQDITPNSLARATTGFYSIGFPTGTLTQKTFVNIYLAASTTAATGLIGVSVFWASDIIQISTKNPATNALADSYLDNARIEIQVYE